MFSRAAFPLFEKKAFFFEKRLDFIAATMYAMYTLSDMYDKISEI